MKTFFFFFFSKSKEGIIELPPHRSWHTSCLNHGRAFLKGLISLFSFSLFLVLLEIIFPRTHRIWCLFDSHAFKIINLMDCCLEVSQFQIKKDKGGLAELISNTDFSSLSLHSDIRKVLEGWFEIYIHKCWIFGFYNKMLLHDILEVQFLSGNSVVFTVFQHLNLSKCLMSHMLL